MADEDLEGNTGRPNEPSDLSPKILKNIGPYRVEYLIGKGGMSLLYLGTHPETGEPIAIKVLSQKYLSNPEVVKRFLSEAEIISMTDHPHIVKLYGHGEWEGGLYIAMEFMQGITLRQYILQHPISLPQALKIVIDIAYALCHLHTHGVIHRDLKPENIIIKDSGEVKVFDFGIAQLLTEEEKSEKAGKPRMMGTPIYMSPEQKENPEEVSFQADIYSLGIITYELILGKLSHGKIHLSLMPRGIQKILYKALQPRPEDRFEDIVDFISEVSSYMVSPAMESEKNIASHAYGNLIEEIRTVQKDLLPEQVPEWPPLEIGVSQYKGMALVGVYFDFFQLSDSRYAIVLCESSALGVSGILYTAVLRGMIRSLIDKKLEPTDFVKALNTQLFNDHLEPIFTFTLLTLDEELNTYRFLSCGYSPLWHLAKGSSLPDRIETKNVALGIDPEAEFSEFSGTWELGDRLIFCTYALVSEKKDQEWMVVDENLFNKIILENQDLPSQKFVDTVLRRIRMLTNRNLPDRPIALICLKKMT